MDTKPALRRRLALARAQRTPADRAAAGRALADLAVPAWRGLSVVTAYAAVGTEPPTRPLLDGLREAGVAVWLPVVDGDRLDWASYDGWDRLAAGPHGLLQPAGAALGPDAVALAALVLVPALAVDGRGHRLGRGAGYYDRTLAGVPVPSVAVVYDEERLDALPTGPHDVAVDGVLSPAGLAAVSRDDARSVPGVPRGR